VVGGGGGKGGGWGCRCGGGKEREMRTLKDLHGMEGKGTNLLGLKGGTSKNYRGKDGTEIPTLRQKGEDVRISAQTVSCRT